MRVGTYELAHTILIHPLIVLSRGIQRKQRNQLYFIELKLPEYIRKLK